MYARGSAAGIAARAVANGWANAGDAGIARMEPVADDAGVQEPWLLEVPGLLGWTEPRGAKKYLFEEVLIPHMADGMSSVTNQAQYLAPIIEL